MAMWIKPPVPCADCTSISKVVTNVGTLWLCQDCIDKRKEVKHG